MRVQHEQRELGSGTIGVVTPRSLLNAITTEMDQEQFHYGAVGAGALDSDVTVLAADIAKGLEFDSVIVVEPRLIVSETAQGIRALYVALTRTTNRLSLVYVEQLPPYLVAN